MRIYFLTFGLFFLFAAGAEANQSAQDPDSRATLSGHIHLLDEDGARVDDPAEFANTVIYFEPQGSSPELTQELQVDMVTRRRQFVPRVLAVQTGTTVTFPNDDPILHNVFSSSTGNTFDLGLYGQSPGKTHRFDRPGLVRVFCNVHPGMSAHIVVIDSPHFMKPDRHGLFTLTDLPTGPGRLTVWHERSHARQFNLDLTTSSRDLGPIELALTVRQIEPQRERRRPPPRRRRY
jgi:plastocyanin